MAEEQKHLFFQVFILVCDKFKTKNSGINHYFKNNIKDLLDVLFKAISGNAEKAVS